MHACRAVSILLSLAVTGCATSGQEAQRTPAESRLRVAQVAEASGQTDVALSMYAAAVEQDPRDPVARARYAGVLARTGQMRQAEQVLNTGLASGTDSRLLVELGRLRLRSGQPDEARALFARVLERDSRNAGAL
ncbi:MAG TPA: tetratricopeptide repeat protein, partial [Roseomonas sp.]